MSALIDAALSRRRVGGLTFIHLGPFSISYCKLTRARRRLLAAKAKARLFAD